MPSRARFARTLPPLLFAAAALVFLLPFVTVGCDDTVTAKGIDFVTGHVPPAVNESGETSEDDEDAENIIREGAPAATLALAFAVGAAVLALLPGALAAGTALLAGVFGSAALGLFLLGLDLRSESILSDLRAGFWLAGLFLGTATVLAWRHWSALPVAAAGRARGLRLVTTAIPLLALAVIVPHVSPCCGGDDEERQPVVFLSWFVSLAPGGRGTAFWTAIGVIGVLFLVALARIWLPRSTTPARGAAIIAALGLGGLLLAAESIGYSATFSGLSVGDGAWLYLGGSGLALAGGVVALREVGWRGLRASRSAVVIAILGAAICTAATLVPYDRGGGDLQLASRPLLQFDADLDRWVALAPLGLALAVIVSVLLLGAQPASGALLGFGVTLAFAFRQLMYPAFASGEDADGMPLGPAGAVGLVGAALVLVAGVPASRERPLDYRVELEAHASE